MTGAGFDTRFDRLPESLPIFPLKGVLLLPRARLPLNIFEPRYLNMFDDALASDRLIGMIQPLDDGPHPAISRIGCVGRITSFAEEGNRYMLTLTGTCRFDVVEEVPTMRGYRRVLPDWTPYKDDFIEEEGGFDRARLLAGLKAYFRVRGLTTDWTAIEGTGDERLVNSLAVLCPFSHVEKQALLEAGRLVERAKLLIGLIEIATLNNDPDESGPRHWN